MAVDTTTSGSAQRSLERCRERIAACDPVANAILTRMDALADEQAAGADRAESQGEWLGLLHGVPITLKDCLNVAGYRTTFGSALYADHVPNSDSAVVTRLRRSGAVFVAKTNLTEFCYGATGENTAFGDINNPWDPRRVPGGSSSGAGASVSTDMCRIAIGSDTGGSIRIPASFCGVVGLRPTFGRVSNANALELTLDFDTIGPLARSVADVARAFAAIAGHDPEDIGSADRPLENFLPMLRSGVKGMRIGLPRRFFFEGLEAGIGEAVEAAALVLERAGAVLVEIEVPQIEDAQAHGHTAMVRADMADIHRDEMEHSPGGIGPEVLRRLTLGLDISGRDYARARRWMATWRLDLRRLFMQVDILLTPTTPVVAPQRRDAADMVETTRQVARLAAGLGTAGLPCMSLPCGLGTAGMPIGLHLCADFFGESLLFRAGAAFQEQTDFHRLRPPLAKQ